LLRLLRPLSEQFDNVILDCPPNISLVSENIFRAADALLIPTIPGTLSIRAYHQLLDYLRENRVRGVDLMPFFSMVDRDRHFQLEVIEDMTATNPEVLSTHIPYAGDVEKMGVRRAPVGEFAPQTPAWEAYRGLWAEVVQRLG
jgi:cellulose biosynthesis protein BcsQ